MSIVEIDERGRVTIPKEMRVDAERAFVIPMGETYMIVPIPKAPIEFEIEATGRTAKERAERKMAAEVRARAKRRQE